MSQWRHLLQPGHSSCFVSSKRPLGEAHQPINVIILTRQDLVSPFTVVLLEQSSGAWGALWLVTNTH